MKSVFKSLARLLLVPVFLVSAIGAIGQDLHFSQFNNAPANLNPALTGVFAGDVRFIANYRSQWTSVPVDYRTISAAFDAKYQHKLLGKKSLVGYGLVLNNDVAGNAEIGITQIGANLAYTRQMSDAILATIGMQFMVGQRSVSPQKLSYESQWNGDLYDPDLSAGEAFANTSRTIASFAVGINLHYQLEGSRTKLDGGIGFHHLNQPNTSFKGDPAANLALKFTPYLFSTFQVAPKIDFRANAQFSKQLEYRELLAGVAARYYLRDLLSVQAGISTRFSDALIPSIELGYRNWTVGFSYDRNFSPFKVATNQRGGPELFLQYILWKVHPPKEYKACPVF